MQEQPRSAKKGSSSAEKSTSLEKAPSLEKEKEKKDQKEREKEKEKDDKDMKTKRSYPSFQAVQLGSGSLLNEEEDEEEKVSLSLSLSLSLSYLFLGLSLSLSLSLCLTSLSISGSFISPCLPFLRANSYSHVVFLDWYFRLQKLQKEKKASTEAQSFPATVPETASVPPVSPKRSTRLQLHLTQTQARA